MNVVMDYSGHYIMNEDTRIIVRRKADDNYACRWIYPAEQPWPNAYEDRDARTVAKLVDGDTNRIVMWHRTWPVSLLLPDGA